MDDTENLRVISWDPMDPAERNLKKLHRLLQNSTPAAGRPERSLRPRKEQPEDFSEASLPPLKNRKPRGKSPSFFLSRGEVSSQLLKQAGYINQLNRKVIARLGLPFSAHLRLSTITPGGVAVVHADSPSWAQRGRFLQQNILDLLHQEGVRQVTRVKLRVRFSNEPPQPTPLPARQASMEVAEQLSSHSRTAGGELGRSMQQLSNTLLRNRQRRS